MRIFFLDDVIMLAKKLSNLLEIIFFSYKGKEACFPETGGGGGGVSDVTVVAKFKVCYFFHSDALGKHTTL